VHVLLLGPVGHFHVQWTADPHAGFTTGTPWMRVNDDYAEGWNVQAQLRDKASVHAFYQHVLGYRKQSDLLVRKVRSIAPCLYPTPESGIWKLSGDREISRPPAGVRFPAHP
jgi:hypothetical protein